MATPSEDGAHPSKTYDPETYPYRESCTMVPLNLLGIDAVERAIGAILETDVRQRFQREQENLLRRIDKNGFDPKLLLPMVVNKRNENQYSVLDGGGRFVWFRREVAEERLLADVQVPCLVVEVPIQQEPGIYVGLNRDKLKLSKVDIYLAELASGDAEALAIDRIVREASDGRIKVGKSTETDTSPGDINSVDTVQMLLRSGTRNTPEGEEVLARTIRLLCENGWDTEWKGRAGATVGGLGRIVALRNPNHTDEYFARVMSRSTPEAILERAKGSSNQGGGASVLSRGFAFILARDYLNKFGPPEDQRRTGRGMVYASNKYYIDPKQFEVGKKGVRVGK